MGITSSEDAEVGRGLDQRHPTRAALARRILPWGRVGWALVGITVAGLLAWSAVAALAGLIVPSLFAVFAGVCLVPALDRFTRHGLGRRLAALLMILLLGAVVLAGTLLLVRGLLVEGRAIRSTVVAGIATAQSWLHADTGSADVLVDRVFDEAAPLLSGAAGWATKLFSTTMELAIGGFLAVFLLYYVLVDWNAIRDWLARHLGVPTALGEQIISDAIDVVRRGVGVLAVLGVVDAALIAAVMLLLGLPFVLGVAIVLFLGSFVPYLGTFIAGLFAVLVALGGGGPRDAAIMLAVILVVEIVVRTLVGNWLATDRLALRPLPSVASSVVGVALAGLLGAVLSAPALAMGIAISRRVQAAHGIDGGELDN